MKFVLLKSWYGNIGDGFVQKGAKSILERSFPDSCVIEASTLGNDLLSESGIKLFSKYIGGKGNGSISRKFSDFGRKHTLNDPRVEKLANVGDLIDTDVIILAGCVLNSNLDLYIGPINKIRRNGSKIIFLGAGATDYLPSTVRNVRIILEEMKPFALLSRDLKALTHYSDLFQHCYYGIDCAFFINDYYSPPKADKSFIAATFDTIREPVINSKYPIIRPHHSVLKLPLSLPRKFFSISSISMLNFFNNTNSFISDNINDYLFLYSNAKEVHSDRIHACIAALAYGTPTRLYIKTPRDQLFERIVRNINEELVVADSGVIEVLQLETISFLQDILTNGNQ
jgi:hypothetical protein